MSTATKSTFTTKQLYFELEKDQLLVDTDIINKAKNGDGCSMCYIGVEYQSKKQKFDKALAWYRLAAFKNNPDALNNIACLYHFGLGVPKDYFTAMEWHLKSATQYHKTAWGYIGSCFENGFGVPLDKYKALEWYYKCDTKVDEIKKLTEQGIQLTVDDKNKPIEDLIMETEDIFWEARNKEKNKLREEIDSLKQLKNPLEEESATRRQFLENENQTFRATRNQDKKEILHQSKPAEQIQHQEQKPSRENQALMQEITVLQFRLQAKDDTIALMKNEINHLRSASENQLQSIFRKIEDLKRYKENLEEMVAREKQLKETNRNELMNQKMDFLPENDEQTSVASEERNQALKRKPGNADIQIRKKILSDTKKTSNDIYENIRVDSSVNDNDEDTKSNNIKIDDSDVI